MPWPFWSGGGLNFTTNFNFQIVVQSRALFSKRPMTDSTATFKLRAMKRAVVIVLIVLHLLSQSQAHENFEFDKEKALQMVEQLKARQSDPKQQEKCRAESEKMRKRVDELIKEQNIDMEAVRRQQQILLEEARQRIGQNKQKQEKTEL